MLLAVANLPPMFSLLALMLVGVVAVSLLLLRLRQSLLVGYFLCGVAISNTGLLEKLTGPEATQAIGSMSEFGVMWLLFVLGMEFSLRELRHLRRFAFLGGAAQIALTMAVAGLATYAYFGFSWAQVVVIAVACALSSTAISIKLYQDMGISAGAGARLALGIAIFQDLFVIGFLVLLPALFPVAGAGPAMLPAIARTLGQGVAFVGIAFLLARYIIPRVLHAVARPRSRELFTITVAGLCLGVAYLAAIMGLSLVLGAFVAGVAVSECMYKHRIMADVGPFKDLFLTIFFVSVGLGIDVRAVAQDWALVLSIAALLLAGKTFLVAALARSLGLRWHSAVVAGIGLGSAGEFSLVLMGKTTDLTVWPGQANQPLLAAMALSMASVPVLMGAAPAISAFLDKRFPRLLLRQRSVELLPHGSSDRFSDHAIVCGYGPVGRDLVAELERQGIPTVIIDLNADEIRALRGEGRAALFADANQNEVWDLCNLERARLVAFTFPASGAIEPALRAVREKNPVVPVLVRTAFSNRAELLVRSGANIVVEDERETGRAVVHRALRALEIGPRADAE